MEELSSLVLQHCQGTDIIISVHKNNRKRQRDKKTKIQKDEITKKTENYKCCDRPSSKSNQLQPTVLLAASPPSVLSLQVFQLFSHFSEKELQHMHFQLEGAYGRACSVKEPGLVDKSMEEEERASRLNLGNLELGLNINLGLNPVSLSGSREDTVSPMASQRTGKLFSD